MSDTIVTSFCRMNPLTRGHELLIKKMKEIAKEEYGDYCLFLSKKEGDVKNPLTLPEKFYFISKVFPLLRIASAKDIWQVLDYYAECKYRYERIILLAGSDRFEEFRTVLHRYNESMGYPFKEISVRCIGDRIGGAGLKSISGTKMREAVMDNNWIAYWQMTPTNMTYEIAQEMFKKLRYKLH